MKFLIHSNNGDFLGVALRMKKEGHRVSVFIKEPPCRRMGDGLVDKVDSLFQGVSEKPDAVIFDMSGEGKTADRLRSAGLNVMGSSEQADKMEFDRKYGIDLMRKYGIKVPITQDFKKIEDAIAFIKSKPQAYAIKMSGGDSGCASSYVGKDAEDLLEYIAWQQERKLIKLGMEFILQEVVKGVEISTEVWFSHGKPLLPYNGTFENKKFLPGDLGPATGCETSAVFPYLSSSPKMVEKTIQKIFPLALQMKYAGPLDINCIVSEKDHEPYGLEWTPRLGYSAVYALFDMMETGIGEFLYGVSSGTAKKMTLKHTWGTSLKASVPPYPIEKPDKHEIEEALYGENRGLRIKYEDSPHFWPIDAQNGKRSPLECAGVNGIIAECTGVGEDLKDAWLGSCKVFKSLQFPNKMGRFVDGSISAFQRANQLRDWGYDVPNPIKKSIHTEIKR